MLDLFRVPWPNLQLDDVHAFLDETGEEGVTWEAKADDDEDRKPPQGEEPGRLRPTTVRKAACGFANQIGGFLIIGARWDKREQRWRLPGVIIDDPEPELWLGKVLRSLNPAPRFEPKAWALHSGRSVAVVRIEPVDVPPCMTPQGHVYERVSGETVRVREPALLDRLFRRGRAARERAEQFSRRAAARALEAPRTQDELAVGISVALASIGRETDDISSRLFVPSFRDAATNALWYFCGDERKPNNIETWTQQDAFSVLAQCRDFSWQHGTIANLGKSWKSTWLVQAMWDGTVTACATFAPRPLEELAPVEEVVLPGWREIAPLVAYLGGYGPAHLLVGVHATPDPKLPIPREAVKDPPPPPPPKGTLFARLPTKTWIGRWVSMGAPAKDVLDSLERELMRAAGRRADEPEPDDGDRTGPAREPSVS